MLEVSEIASLVEEQADRDCILIFGAAVNEEMENEVAITVIATGFDEGLENNNEAEKKDRQTSTNPIGVGGEQGDVFGRIDGVPGREVTLPDILKEEENDTTPSRFDIPDFLK